MCGKVRKRCGTWAFNHDHWIGNLILPHFDVNKISVALLGAEIIASPDPLDWLTVGGGSRYLGPSPKFSQK